MKSVLFFTVGMLLTTYSISQQNSQNPRDYVVNLTTTTTENPPSISFTWEPFTEGNSIYIYRRASDTEPWGRPDTILPKTATDFTDYNVVHSVNYEYQIYKGENMMDKITYVNAGIKLPEVEYRGKIILLVDSSFTNDLYKELLQMESDLIGDGWEVLRKDISRNASVKYVKNIIRDFYYSDTINVNSLFLLGHIPVPYSGNHAFDAHKVEHEGAWPADIYYGDMDEKIWTDKTVNITSAKHQENWNIPGDGKFDVVDLKKEKISLSVGRVDFWNLYAFPSSEAELLRNYLNKDHAFRYKLIDPKMQALVDDQWQMVGGQGLMMREGFAMSGWRNFCSLLDATNVKAGSFFNDTKNDSYIWSYGCGPGTFTSCMGIGNTSDFVNQSPKTVFTEFYGSWFGDWNSEDNFMRAALASDGWILTCCWAGRPHYYFHQMGMGETIGNCVKATQNNMNDYQCHGSTNRCIQVSLLGDPTLRMHIVKPVQLLNSEITKYNSIQLNWSAPEDEIIGYYVYKMDTVTKKYFRINDDSISETFFTDNLPEEGNNYYMVRALQLTKSASGSYYNLSQGVFDTINFNWQQNIQPLTEIKLLDSDSKYEIFVYPNPVHEILTIEVPDIGNHYCRIFSVDGKLEHVESFNELSRQINISKLKSGIYYISIYSDKFVDTKKIIKL